MPYEALTKPRLERALRRLATLAAAEGVVLELSLYGGAVFTLVYGSRDSTKDVDALVQPAAVAKRLLAIVAAEQDLPDDWVNDHVRQFVAPREAKRRLATDYGPGLKISVPTAAYLLALKLRAGRPPLPGDRGDEADLEFLLRKIRPRSPAAVAASFEKFFPGDTLTDSARQLVARVLAQRSP